jgi:hypothetical protein
MTGLYLRTYGDEVCELEEDFATIPVLLFDDNPV